NQTVRQGAIGAALGAAAGQLIGGDTESTLIGAAVGGTVGAIRGSSQDRANQQRYRASDGRYYYCYDNNQNECYWDNGQRRY
ncbi:MAG: glycine zipper 2TM domain-containing protein, partial [Variovorax sp.]